MGLKALYVIEAKTRLIEIGKEMDDLRKLLAKAPAQSQTFFTAQMKKLEEDYNQLESDHDLLRMFDESEWGKFSDTVERGLHKLRYDIGVLHAAVALPLVPA